MTKQLEYISFFVGAGYHDTSMDIARQSDLAFIGADAGTVDVGPYQLGGAGTIFPEIQCERDLRLALLAARSRDIPLIVGSCGGSGSDQGVDWFASIVQRIAANEGLRFRQTRIYSDLQPSYVSTKLKDGRVRPLAGAPYYDEGVVSRSTRIVGAMGAEPFMAALSEGADVILAGRATDTAIFAALPLAEGFDPGICWHSAKIAECCTAVAEEPGMDLLHVLLEEDSFSVRPVNPAMRCTPISVSAHQLYENFDPHRLTEPSGTLDASDAQYSQNGGRTVMVRGSKFVTADQYTVKLEGVELAGYQSITMASFTDPVLLEDLDEWLVAMRAEVDRKVQRVIGDASKNATLSLRVYGRDGTMGSLDPVGTFEGHEAFLLLDVVAPRQELASSIASIAWHTMIHFPTRGWTGWLTAAWPYNPPVIDRGPIYRFNVNHVIELDDPLESVRFRTEVVG